MRIARKILFTVVGVGVLGAGAAPAVLSVTAAAAPAATLAMLYDGPHSKILYD